MLKMKYKVISAAMVIAPILSTGVATTVSAAPRYNGPAQKLGVVYKYSYGSFTARLNNLVASGVINSYQESRILAVYNSTGNFKIGLDNLVAANVINSYQESRVLAIFTYSTSGYKPVSKQGHKTTPASRQGHKTTPASKNVGNQKAGNKGGAINKDSGHQSGSINRTAGNKSGTVNIGTHK
ncbi:hypothetical protein [Clostridium sp. HV4-5-A1G]|uniref:hypothetical protein n=1 Tax=Clostridium sp. HV4-5-A1G TaxID=2004595 RepID=UPI0012397824|nr:hypothetical protein [Clostridium sp. HV4-5-A1G]KAA8670659.1 hypothetical protein F3O63_12125 [Clostridium sp. HV4-5-A1G]